MTHIRYYVSEYLCHIADIIIGSECIFTAAEIKIHRVKKRRLSVYLCIRKVEIRCFFIVRPYLNRCLHLKLYAQTSDIF